MHRIRLPVVQRGLSPCRSRILAIGILTGLLGTGIASAQPALCADGRTVVARGESLSDIATRCDVTEGAILAANPAVSGSADLVAGQSLLLAPSTGTAETLGRRLDNFASEADRALGRVADEVGSSAQDLLNKNPDLKSRLEGLGSAIGIGGPDTAATASVTPDSGPVGAVVTVSATGLPAGVPVSIGAASAGRAGEIIQELRASGDGTVSANVAVPDWARGSALVFSVRTEQGVRARTDRFRVTP